MKMIKSTNPLTLILASLPLAIGVAACAVTTGEELDDGQLGQIEQANTDPPPMQCETAFGYGDGYATCFIGADFDNDGEPDGINRWGWSNGPLSPGSYSWDVYAAAGQCDLSKGSVVGTLDVEYTGPSVTATFTAVDGFVADEEHLYIGTDPLPSFTKKNKKGFFPGGGGSGYTVSPGQYPIGNDLNGATTSTNVVNLGRTITPNGIYVVYHAVICGPYQGD